SRFAPTSCVVQYGSDRLRSACLLGTGGGSRYILNKDSIEKRQRLCKPTPEHAPRPAAFGSVARKPAAAMITGSSPNVYYELRLDRWVAKSLRENLLGAVGGQ